MKKTLLIITVLILSQCNLFAQKNKFGIKKHILIENQYMLTNRRFDFFPVTNNEFNISYGINDFTEVGIFHDYFGEPEIIDIFHNKKSRNLFGIKTNISLLSLIHAFGIKNQPKRFELCLSGYWGVYHDRHSKYSIYTYYDKKDNANWAHYYKLGVRFFPCKFLFVSTSVGLINTDRIHIGVGLKL